MWKQSGWTLAFPGNRFRSVFYVSLYVYSYFPAQGRNLTKFLSWLLRGLCPHASHSFWDKQPHGVCLAACAWTCTCWLDCGRMLRWHLIILTGNKWKEKHKNLSFVYESTSKEHGLQQKGCWSKVYRWIKSFTFSMWCHEKRDSCSQRLYKELKLHAG